MKLHPKTPISLVLGALLNIVLVVVFEILVLYRIPVPPTAELLAKMDARYEGCHVIDKVNTDGNRGTLFYRVETANGDTDLVPLKQHSFFPSRGKLLSRKIQQDLDLTEESTRQVYQSGSIYTVFVSNGAVRVMVTATGGGFQKTALTKYLFLGLVLAFFELLIWEKLRG